MDSAMPLSNLRSFHHGICLQNATAFPATHYQATQNHHCLDAHASSLIALTPPPAVVRAAHVHTVTPAMTTSALSVLPIPATSLPISPVFTTREVPAFTLFDPPDRPAIPVTAHAVTTTINRQGKQPIWKPGHGVVEKVDKLTGEIWHLAEECLQAGFSQKISLA